ncbi:MAG: C40 family peptidase [Acidimicrobiaceae bacterium]|nr:C40 family peptidase [Acidimicrobiaceae bacterium]
MSKAPPNTNEAWAIQVLKLGRWPVTKNNITSILQWMASEEPPSDWANRNNPLNNGLGSGGGSGLGSYANLGLAAHYVVANIKTGNYGYGAINEALSKSADPSVTAAAIQRSSWAGSHYGYGASWHSSPVPIVSTSGHTYGTTATIAAPSTSHSNHHPAKLVASKTGSVETRQTEMASLARLLNDGHGEVLLAVSRAVTASDEVRAAATDPLLGSEAAPLVQVADELWQTLTQLGELVFAMHTLVQTTEKAMKKADTGKMDDPALAALLAQLRKDGVPPSVLKVIERDSGKPKSASGSGVTVVDKVKPNSVTARERKVVSAARSYLGTPYVYGGDSRSGIDCSGLTSSAYHNAFGIDIGRDTSAQLASGQVVGHDGNWSLDKKLLQPGDLIFYGQPGASGPNAHVVMYLGGGKVIEAAHSGTDVRIVPLYSSASSDEPFLGVRRYIHAKAGQLA